MPLTTPLAACSRTYGRTLIVLGHGSHLNADSASAVRLHAAAVRGLGLFDQVLEGYWKDEPSLRRLLLLAQFEDVTVVPLFVSQGYFTGQVIPRELGLTEPQQGFTVRYTPPYGVHPAMPAVILARVREVLGEWSASDTALVVLGHGTGRDRQSAEAIEAAALALREGGAFGGLFSDVLALYLDQDPQVSGWPTLTRAPNVVIVPFFASEGWHTQETIPEELGLSGPETVLDSDTGTSGTGTRRVYYTRPVGTHPAVTEVIVKLVSEYGALASAAPRSPRWQKAGERLRALAQAEFGVGELAVLALGDGFYRVCHSADRTASGPTASHSTAPNTAAPKLETIPLQELSAYTGRSEAEQQGAAAHRPIRTLRGLRRGWQAVVNTDSLRDALHAVYPGVLEEASAWQDGALPVTPWQATADRQSGIYRRVRRAEAAQVAQAQARVCGGCLRTPLWAGETLSTTFLQGQAQGLPCPEACTLLVSAVRVELEGLAQ